jgi:hypothetical protein
MCAALTSGAAAAADNGKVVVEAVQILGSKQAGDTDPSLARFNVASLPGGFQSFRRVGGGTLSITAPGTGRIGLSAGQRVDLEVQSASGGEVSISAVLMQGGRPSSARATMQAERGAKIVLFGPSSPDGDGRYFVIVVAR